MRCSETFNRQLIYRFAPGDWGLEDGIPMRYAELYSPDMSFWGCRVSREILVSRSYREQWTWRESVVKYL